MNAVRESEQFGITPILGKPGLNPIPIAARRGRRVEELGEEERVTIARQFFLTGNLSAIARDYGVNYNDLLDLSREAWFEEEVRNLEREANAQLKVQLTSLMGRTLEELTNRLEGGDTVYCGNQLRRIPIPARDLAGIAKVIFEKKRELAESEAGFQTAEKRRLFDMAAILRAKSVPEIVEGGRCEAPLVSIPEEASNGQEA